MLSVIDVQARGCEIPAPTRVHFEEKLHGLEKIWSRLDDAQIRVSHERGHHVVEITLHSAGLINRAEERNHDLRTAFDAAVQKLQNQLKRYKDKVQHKDRRQNNRDDAAGVILHPKSDAEVNATATLGALAAPSPAPEPETAMEVDGDEAPASLVRRKQFALKPMSPDEATLQMDLLGHDFFVFRDSKNNSVSVVYRRGSGGYGLIEPVAD